MKWFDCCGTPKYDGKNKQILAKYERRGAEYAWYLFHYTVNGSCLLSSSHLVKERVHEILFISFLPIRSRHH
jgi:hypothetical protein